MVELAEEINRLTGNPDGVYNRSRVGDDRSDANRILHERGKFALGTESILEEGLMRTIPYFEQAMKHD